MEEEKTMTHIEFEIIERKKKTNVYSVSSKYDQSLLGTVFWYGRWRQYVFQPILDTLWNEKCILEVYRFIHKLKLDRKLAIQNGEQYT